MKLFQNAKLILENSVLEDAFLIEQDGKILSFGNMASIPSFPKEIIDCQGLFLSPGFIDLHTHGGGGYDIMDGTAEAIANTARMHMAHGTTSIMPTTLTSSDKDLYAVIDAYHEVLQQEASLPHMLGLHLEGPYFSKKQKGAQPEQYIISPTPDHFLKILDYAKGSVKRWSLAPELPGASELIETLVKQDILVSAAHTDATLTQIKESFTQGLSLLTHLYSSMSSITRVKGHRVLGVVEAGYLIDDLYVELIADGIHLPPELLRMILRFKDHDKICLCTDSMRAAGMPEGTYLLGAKKEGYEVLVESGIAVLHDRTAFAGSVATANRCIRIMVQEVGLSLASAVKMISLNPARLIKKESEIGSIAIGKQADLVMFDSDFTVKSVYVSGKKMLG